MVTETFNPAEHALSELQQNKEFYLKDIDALTEEQLNASPGGNARVAYDFIYEVVVINQRLAARLRLEEPPAPAWKFGEEWAVAPASFRNKETAKAEIAASIDEVIIAFKNGDPNRPCPTSEGDKPAVELALFASMHCMYHLAQLNYIQAFYGDLGIHWF